MQYSESFFIANNNAGFLVTRFIYLIFLPIIFVVNLGCGKNESGNLMSKPIAKIDSVGVEKIIRNVISSKYQFHSMIGLHFENQTTATAYFRVRRRRDTTGGEAKIFYITHNGWYIRSIHVAPRTMGYNSWENLLIKIEPTSEPEPAEEEEEPLYDWAPEPIGGFASIQKKLEYPVAAKKAGIEGQTFVEINVGIDGTVLDARVIKSLGRSDCDSAAINAVKRVKWKPARKDGTPVKAKVSVPVLFRLK